MRRPTLSPPLVLIALSVTACRVGPDYVEPEIQLPDAWFEDITEGLTTGESDIRTWWKLLDDPLLEELLARTASSNHDLRIAYDKIREARAERGIAAGTQLPDLQVFGSASRERVGAGSLNIPGFTGTTDNRYEVGLDSQWEIDVWGRVARLVESADASLEARIESYRDVMVLLFAEVGIQYYELRSLQERIRFAENNIKLQRNTLELTRDRRRAELVPQLDVHQAEYNLARTESLLPELRGAASVAVHRIGVLTGGWPGAWGERLQQIKELPDPPESLVVGLPRDLMRQRPDIRAAERQLAAQTARIGVATAELYPRFTLSGFFSFSAVTGPLFDQDNTNWGFGLPVRWSLFSNGRVQSQIEAEEVRTEQALAVYERQVLLALEDVENSIAGFVNAKLGVRSTQQAVTALEESNRLVQDLYTNGLVDFQRVLDSQRALFDEQDRLAERRGSLIQSLVGLFRAMGGGWDPEARGEPADPRTAGAGAGDDAGAGR